ncbi:MAG: ABC transporter permease [Clostridiales bacterium]|jgi:peptide/nickel transport system permease protein|nr:ABC transporter permease [Clostridiales bacterium]
MINKFLSQKRAVFCFAFILLLLFAAIIGGAFTDGASARVSLTGRSRPPSREHPLGTDPSGRDMLGQLVTETRNSLLIAVGITALTCAFGTAFGLIAGYFGGVVDMALMRVLDFVSMLPRLMLIIVFVTLISEYGPVQLALIMSALGWMYDARIIRGKALSLRDEDFIRAARSVGAPAAKIIARHFLPHLAPVIIVNFTLNLAGSIGVETGLSFLGFGLPFATPRLGTLLNYAYVPENLQNRPWLWLPAVALIFIVMMCIHYTGGALKRAIND